MSPHMLSAAFTAVLPGALVVGVGAGILVYALMARPTPIQQIVLCRMHVHASARVLSPALLHSTVSFYS